MIVQITYNEKSRVLKYKRITIDSYEMENETTVIIKNGNRKSYEWNVESIIEE